MREVRGGRGKAGGVSELVADTTLHQPRRPVVIVGDVTGPVMWSVSGTAQLARCLARQHRLYDHDTARLQLPVLKGKEEYLYSAFLAKVVHSKRSGMDHTVLPANNTMPAFPS